MPTEEKLLNAAILLMSENGYHRTTVADIVKAAGVAQGTFYLYFDSKKALFIKLMERFYDMLESALVAVDLNLEAIKTPEDFALLIRTAIRNVLLVYRDNAVLARIFLREAMGLEPDFAELWDSINERLAAVGAFVTENAIELGLIPQQNSKIVAHCVVGMVERVAYYWLFQENDFELDEVVDALTRFELYGVTCLPSKTTKSIK
ncbi:MAG: TetR/AcrR family transcriptional regulator [Anaerolineales bacterium]